MKLRNLFLVVMMALLLSSCTVNLININPFGPVKPPKRTKHTNDTVLHLRLSGSMEEYSVSSGFNLFGGNHENLHNIIQKINHAKTDKRISSILLQPQGFSPGMAARNELRFALEDFKKSGKKVYGYFSGASQGDILLLSVADEVYMNPSASAGFVMNGLGIGLPFFNELLEKIGVSVHVIRAGEYKNAGEPFTNREMSPETRENYSLLVNDLYEELVADLARSYDISIEDVKFLYEQREKYVINMQEALDTGIIDELLHFDDMLKKLDINRSKLVNISRYRPKSPKLNRDRIAVVYMLGSITSSGGGMFSNSSFISANQYVRIFTELREDKNVHAVVLRIDSGGGSALESEIIHDAIAKLREEKPVVVSFGSTAASGGYYLATNAHHIVADPYNVTGSIGVFGMILNFSETASRVGVNMESVGKGKFSNSGDPFSEVDEEFINSLQLGVNDTYIEFKTRVAEGRNKTFEQVEAIAQGQVWSARAALRHGLIDEIGGIDAAIRKAIELSNVRNHSLDYYPKQSSSENAFLAGFGASISEAMSELRLPTILTQRLSLIEEIRNNPIQMRSEVVISE
jgi:protease-4